MNIREFNIEDINLKFFVGIGQINFNLTQFLKLNKINNEEEALTSLFNIIEEIQGKNENSMIQFIKDKYLLNKDHLFTACYFLQKAFYYNTNISNKKSIELLLYLSTNRQINKAIEAFGIDINDLRSGKLTICIISQINTLKMVNSELLHILKANEIESTINTITIDKMKIIKQYYEISDNQIFSVLNSYGVKEINDQISKIDLDSISLALYDLLCERMSLLNLEKVKNG